MIINTGASSLLQKEFIEIKICLQGCFSKLLSANSGNRNYQKKLACIKYYQA
jgi:hypothetical protein